MLKQHKTRLLTRRFLYFSATKNSIQNVKLVHFHEKDDAGLKLAFLVHNQSFQQAHSIGRS